MKENRFVEERFVVERRNQPVTARNHLDCRDRVVAFVRIPQRGGTQPPEQNDVQKQRGRREGCDPSASFMRDVEVETQLT